MNHPNELSNVEKIKQLVDYLNLQRNAYYNENSPNISDAEYDRIFDELVELEKQTGFILSNSPTQTVGYTPISELPKVKHPVPLLSLDKTKQVQDLISFAGKQPVLFMLKLDGLTTKLVYENGTLVEASTRGDGEIGELITHNIPAYVDVPLSIPYKGRLVIVGESFIPTHDFERLKETLRDGKGEPYKNGRNLASGSVRSLDPANCAGRCLHFMPFNVLEGLDSPFLFPDSRAMKISSLFDYGFQPCPYIAANHPLTSELVNQYIERLTDLAGKKHLPIDGIVMIFDSLDYSKNCGRTGHHYKDGLAFKFEDETYETTL